MHRSGPVGSLRLWENAMSTPERLRARAEEAERLADIVSYGRDKERLAAQAAEMRERADALEAHQQHVEAAPTPRRKLPAWLSRWLPHRKQTA
jgi:hypothetical protein